MLILLLLPVIYQSPPTEILKLNELKNKGLLTDEEYEKAKNKILN